MGFNIGSVMNVVSTVASAFTGGGATGGTSSGGSTAGNLISSFVDGFSGAQNAQGASGAEGGESTEDQTKAMIDQFIFSQLDKMREESSKKLEEALKKTVA